MARRRPSSIRNSGTSDQTFVIDLSKYGEIADNAYGELYLTTGTSAEDKNVGVDSATPEVFRPRLSNVKQAEGSVVIDKAAKTATATYCAGPFHRLHPAHWRDRLR